ncbi:unnamed protein product [Rotaria magnacalcarata]|uniref:Uncharacterized protein n=2 Tax=Rotaria magnacalcarata TaxID=392030 RepID=A0A819CKU0_9BILA|nr:unnamed protein product [Rotaria magnacalcarata]CAF3820999.1 unnamed protein product [Rotaria magnacalcarata]
MCRTEFVVIPMNYMIAIPSRQQAQSQKDVDNDPTLNRMTVQSSINNRRRQQQQQSIEKQLVLLLHALKCQQRE